MSPLRDYTSLTAPIGYAIIYHCKCGCQPPKRFMDHVCPTDKGWEEDQGVMERCKKAAEEIAEGYILKGYIGVSVEPLYSSPEVGLN